MPRERPSWLLKTGLGLRLAGVILDLLLFILFIICKASQFPTKKEGFWLLPIVRSNADLFSLIELTSGTCFFSDNSFCLNKYPRSILPHSTQTRAQIRLCTWWTFCRGYFLRASRCHVGVCLCGKRTMCAICWPE
jgi:hypothetical protein